MQTHIDDIPKLILMVHNQNSKMCTVYCCIIMLLCKIAKFQMNGIHQVNNSTPIIPCCFVGDKCTTSLF